MIRVEPCRDGFRVVDGVEVLGYFDEEGEACDAQRARIRDRAPMGETYETGNEAVL